ncbi:MAG: hypothetical protein WEF86_01735 [Gemmatimonadota bacterium]
MKIALLAIAPLLLLPPLAGSAQEYEVTRQSYTFMDDRLVISVVGNAPGELQLVRGGRGRVEVAARSELGFPGFGLGGNFTRELRLTAVGAGRVQYLVVVPERVSVSVRLPGGGAASLPTRAAHASYDWGSRDAFVVAADATAGLPLLPTLPGGMFLIHSGTWAPATVNVPDLTSIRTLSVRFEGSEFRIAASRPLSLVVGTEAGFELRISGEPVDLALYVPRGNATFELRSGADRLARLRAGRVEPLCGNVTVQKPTPSQDWLTFHPQDGRLACR